MIYQQNVHVTLNEIELYRHMQYNIYIYIPQTNTDPLPKIIVQWRRQPISKISGIYIYIYIHSTPCWHPRTPAPPPVLIKLFEFFLLLKYYSGTPRGTPKMTGTPGNLANLTPNGQKVGIFVSFVVHTKQMVDWVSPQSRKNIVSSRTLNAS